MSSTILSPTVGQPDRFPTTFFIILKKVEKKEKKKNNLLQGMILNFNRQMNIQESLAGEWHSPSPSIAHLNSTHPWDPSKAPALTLAKANGAQIQPPKPRKIQVCVCLPHPEAERS